MVVEGSKYGLELNWTKTYQMNINSNSTILWPDGVEMEKKRSIIYLGGMISCDGKSGVEVRRRVSEGRSAFKILSRLWSHANVPLHRKLDIFNACITSKVLYSLESLWLLQTDRSRLDAFQCSCVRQILRIAPSFISRVSNADVLSRARQMQYSCMFKKTASSTISEDPVDAGRFHVA